MAERLGVHPNSISFNYENKNYKSNSDDKKPPLLKDFVVSEVGKNEMLVTLKIDDSQSGVISEEVPTSSGGYGDIGELVVSPSGNQKVEASILNSQRIDGDEYSGTYQVPIKLSDYHEPGIWSLDDIELADNAGNELEVASVRDWRQPNTSANIDHLATTKH